MVVMPCCQVLASLLQPLLQSVHVLFKTWSSRMLHKVEGRRMRRLKGKKKKSNNSHGNMGILTQMSCGLNGCSLSRQQKKQVWPAVKRLNMENNKFLKHLMLCLLVSQVTTQGWKFMGKWDQQSPKTYLIFLNLIIPCRSPITWELAPC